MDNIQSLLSNQGTTALKKLNSANPMYAYIIIVFGIFLIWFFTYFQFQFGISIFFAIIVMLSFAKINIVASIVFALVYAYIIYHLFQDRRKISGDIISQTDMEKNGKPFIASSESAQISSENLPKSGEGNNFSYSFWLYINSVPIYPTDPDYQKTWLNYRYGDWKSVFYRGNDMSTTQSSVSTKQQFPGVWLAPTKNTMSIVFQNGESNQKVERLDIEDIPLNRWFYISIVVEGNSVSVYKDGEMENIIVLNQMIPSNIQEKDLFICKDSFLNFVSEEKVSSQYQCPGNCIPDDKPDDTQTKSGFAGFIGEMVYFPYVLKNEEIEKNYHFYKRIIDSYQKDKFQQDVSFPPLITSKSKTSQTYSNPNILMK
jgi:hypothetical protein